MNRKEKVSIEAYSDFTMNLKYWVKSHSVHPLLARAGHSSVLIHWTTIRALPQIFSPI